MKGLLVFVGSLLCSAIVLGDLPYDFDWDSKNDMRGATYMCAPTGFSQGECPKVLNKCWKPPMIYFKRHKSHYHIKSYCFNASPIFSGSDGDAKNAVSYASKQVDQEVDTDAYLKAAEARIKEIATEIPAEPIAEVATSSPSELGDFFGFECSDEQCIDPNLPTGLKLCIVVTTETILGETSTSQSCTTSTVPYQEAAASHGKTDCANEVFEDGSKVETCNSFYSDDVENNTD